MTATMTTNASKVIEQLRNVGKRQVANGSEHFSSDGSRHPSKQAIGKLFKIGRTTRGLKLYIQCGETVRLISWRIPQKRVAQIIRYIYLNNYASR